ncbi:MAG: alanine dehydrogenase [Chitinophagales bacterium]
MANDASKSSGITAKLGLQPQESPQMIATNHSKLFIGLPKERAFQEQRIGLTPEAVEILVAQGHRVTIEHDAGKECGFYDYMYSEAGADITKNTEEVFKADTIIKVAPPTLFELELLQMEQTLISPIHMPTLSKEYLYYLMKKRTTAIAFEHIRDTEDGFPFVSSMSEIAGISSIQIAAEYLSNANNGKGLLLGGISGVPPTKIVILGAGVVGTSAARAALGMGAQISVFDDNLYKLQRLQDKVNQRVFTSILSSEIIARELETADIVIGAIHNTNGRTPVIVSDQMVSNMKSGSVIIDISIDQGGCFATSELTSHEKPTYIKHDVIHYCVPNIPSRVAKTASHALSHILYPILNRSFKAGGISQQIHIEKGIRQGVYSYNGHLTNEHLARKFDMKYTNLDLVFMAGM